MADKSVAGYYVECKTFYKNDKYRNCVLIAACSWSIPVRLLNLALSIHLPKHLSTNALRYTCTYSSVIRAVKHPADAARLPFQL